MKINQKHLVYFEEWFIFGIFLVYFWFIFEINQISFKSFGHRGIYCAFRFFPPPPRPTFEIHFCQAYKVAAGEAKFKPLKDGFLRPFAHCLSNFLSFSFFHFHFFTKRPFCILSIPVSDLTEFQEIEEKRIYLFFFPMGDKNILNEICLPQKPKYRKPPPPPPLPDFIIRPGII